MTIETITAHRLSGLPHAFLGRRGGVSSGTYAGLNIALGSKDDRASVLENRRRAVQAVMPGAELARVYQVHSPDVITVTQAPDQDNPPKADAMVTNTPGILLGISTADCVPVLFADREAGIVGAAHSGWKGAIGGVNEATLAAMEALGADRNRIACAIGPCIFGGGKSGHHQFDIEGFVAARLAAAGVRQIECLGQDTYSQPERFFSYRRTCHAGEPDYGTQISLIGVGM
jgi:polyphenol oxidase